MDWQAPDDLSGLGSLDPKHMVHELGYRDMKTFNSEFRKACKHLERFVQTIRRSMESSLDPAVNATVIQLDFGVADAFVSLEQGNDPNRWFIGITMYRPDLADG